LNSETGALQERLQEFVFLKGGEEDLEGADKTRKALVSASMLADFEWETSSRRCKLQVIQFNTDLVLCPTFSSLPSSNNLPSHQRYGSHNLDIGQNHLTFVADL